MTQNEKISKSRLIEEIAAESNLAKPVVKEIVDTLFVKIEAAMAAGAIVTIQGFARYFTRPAQGRSFKKIHSEEIIEVGPRTLPKVKFSKKLVERIKD